MPQTIDTDLVIIGAGPGGITAALYAARQGLNVTLISAEQPGGQMLTTANIQNYPGFENISGKELAEKMMTQAKKAGAQLVSGGVVKLAKKGNQLSVITAKGIIYKAKAVIIATGAKYKKLGIPGEKEFMGRGVSNCTTCDGPFFKGKTVAVIGGGNTALTSALFLASLAKKVYIIHRREEFRGSATLEQEIKKKGVEAVLDSVCTEVKGDKIVKSIVVQNLKDKKKTEIPVDGVFINIGITSTTAVAESIGVELSEDKSVKVNVNMQTNVPGVFAAGDITGNIRQIITSCGEGAIAALNAYKYIRALEGKTVDVIDWN
ncbi:MAG: thioredoxin-disulfide reductase [archaeon]